MSRVAESQSLTVSDIQKRIAPKFNVGEHNCWLWDAALDKKGYGRFLVNGKNRTAHTVMYDLIKGNIPLGLELDHLCETKNCINPDHLEPVTTAENLIRRIHPSSRKTHCKNGHPFARDNFYTVKATGRSYRFCNTCNRNRMREKRRKLYASR